MSAARRQPRDAVHSSVDPATAGQAPWLHEATAALRVARASGRIPHALLLQGAEGTGADAVAVWAAQLVLCVGAEARDRPCGQCVSCRWVASGQHPDLTIIRPAEESRQIRIDQVRALCAQLALTSHQGGYKAAIVDPADGLNRAAANALLKTLEEPASGTLLMLVAAEPSRLPATLVSRCQRVRLRRPTRAESLDWLQRVRGQGDWESVLAVLGEAPLAAAAWEPDVIAKLRAEVARTLEALCAGRADPVATAEQWSRSELAVRLACVENWLTDRIRRGLGARPQDAEVRTMAQPREAVSVYKLLPLFSRLDDVRALKAALAGPINRSLALESVLRSFGGTAGHLEAVRHART